MGTTGDRASQGRILAITRWGTYGVPVGWADLPVADVTQLAAFLVADTPDGRHIAQTHALLRLMNRHADRPGFLELFADDFPREMALIQVWRATPVVPTMAGLLRLLDEAGAAL